MIIKDWELPENRLNIKQCYKNKAGVYCLESKIDDRIYIGSSKNIGGRISEHYNRLISNRHGNKRLQNFINKYGISQLALHITVIDQGRDRLFEIETAFIEFFECCASGFNLSDTARGGPSSKEQRKIVGERMKLVNTGKICSEEHKRKVGVAKSIQNTGSRNPGSKLTEEDVIQIKLLRLEGTSYKQIMEQFGLRSKSHLWSILNNKAWKHVK